MKQIVVISGKGGTGKTVITGSLACLAKNKVLADCDVDAADLHLLLNPQIIEKHKFTAGKTAKLDISKCTGCGRCIGACRFGAILRSPPADNPAQSRNHKSQLFIDSVSCEGCGICFYVCPEKAIGMEDNISGEWYISDTKYGPFVHAKLGIAEENSGKLVSIVRQKAKTVAEKQNRDLVIIDGPPGIGCPVIAALSGVDLALIVTEPTLSGIHDLERVIDVAGHFGIRVKVIINKYDINLDNVRQISEKCKEKNIEVAAQISFSKEVIKSVVKGIPVVEFCNGKITEEINDLWNRIKKGRMK